MDAVAGLQGIREGSRSAQVPARAAEEASYVSERGAAEPLSCRHCGDYALWQDGSDDDGDDTDRGLVPADDSSLTEPADLARV
jgi:hypothetical protein